MRTQLLALGGAFLIAAVLTVAFSLWRTFVAPVLFSELWHDAQSSLTSVAYALFVPTVVTLPFGAAFGLLPWRRPLIFAAFVGLVPGGFVVVNAAWHAVTLGHPLNWITSAHGLLFVVLFAGVAYSSSRLSLHVPVLARLMLGAAMFVALVLAAACLIW